MFNWLKNRLFRRFSYIALGLISILAIVWLAIPYMISTDLVKERFELEISNSIGQKVTFANNPQVTLWPQASIVLENIVVGNIKQTDDDALLRADKFSADMSILSALLGEPSFSNYKLTRPTMRVEIYPDGTSNWLPASTIFSGSINQDNSTQIKDVTLSSTVQMPKLEYLNVDDLEIEGGSLSLITNPGSEPERITSINGRLSWLGVGSPLNLNLAAIVRGEEITLRARNDQPISFIQGENVNIDLDLTSAMFNLKYQGDLEIGENVFLKGKIVLDTPSARRALEWSGSEIKPGAALGSIDLTADITGTLHGIKLEDLIIKIGENRGLGILDFVILKDSPPTINGTLAFNTLDISSFLRAFTPLPQSSENIADTIDTRFLKQVGLDLRLSAQTASFGAVEMSNLAAAVQVNKEDATFNIGDANAYGGQVFAKVSISEKVIEGGGEIALSARGVNFDDFFTTMKLSGPLPRGIGDLDLKLASDRPLWATTIEDIKGSISLKVSDGIIPGLDLNLVRQLAEKKEFFNLDDVKDGIVTFEQAELNAEIDSGVARIKTAQVTTRNELLVFSGIVPFAKGSLAVLGLLNERDLTTPTPQTNETTSSTSGKPALSLFIGGSWPNPVMSPPINEFSFPE